MANFFWILRVIFFCFLSLLGFFSCSSINKKFGLNDDNIIEESIESFIDHKTGIDIDFTPFSPEF